MGSGQSKLPKVKKSERAGRGNDSSSEKHHSADSKAPLAEHAAHFTFPHSPSIDRHGSVVTTDTRLHSVCTDEDLQPPTVASPAFTLHAAGASPSLPAAVQVSATEGHSNVSRPPPPPHLHHLSELIDPEDLSINSHVRTPSGNLLALEQFLVHPNRPRSIRERQETIRETVRTASRLGTRQSGEMAHDPMPGGRHSAERGLALGKEERVEGKRSGGGSPCGWGCGCVFA